MGDRSDPVAHEVLDAVALIVQNPGVSARARDLADQTSRRAVMSGFRIGP